MTLAFVKSWLDLCSTDNFSSLKDPAPDELQITDFVAHRHDQSCLSATAYMFGLQTRPDETWFKNWREAKTYPILALRNRKGRTKLYKVFGLRRLKEKLGLLR